MTNRQEVLNRIGLLRDAIAYSRSEQKIMNIGEGIMCNQEVASWFKVLDEEVSDPKYSVSEIINNKILEIEEIIKATNWERPKEL